MDRVSGIPESHYLAGNMPVTGVKTERLSGMIKLLLTTTPLTFSQNEAQHLLLN